MEDSSCNAMHLDGARRTSDLILALTSPRPNLIMSGQWRTRTSDLILIRDAL